MPSRLGNLPRWTHRCHKRRATQKRSVGGHQVGLPAAGQKFQPAVLKNVDHDPEFLHHVTVAFPIPEGWRSLARWLG